MNLQYSADQITAMHLELVAMFKDLMVPFMEIRRDIPFAGSIKRQETDTEHIFSLSMIALCIDERLNLKLDRGLIAQYALIHDLVEAYAGDVSAKADEHLLKAKLVDEAKALESIKIKYSTVFPWIPKMCMAYENKIDKESKFVYSLDKLMGTYTWLAGDVHYWEEYYPTEKPDLLNITVERLRSKIKQQDKSVLPLFDSIDVLLKESLRKRKS